MLHWIDPNVADVDIPFTCLEVECSAIVCSLFISAHGLRDSFFLLYVGFSSTETLVPRNQDAGFPATVAAVKNPNPKVVYDEYNNERYSPGDPSKRGFAYFALNGGRFIYCVSSY